MGNRLFTSTDNKHQPSASQTSHLPPPSSLALSYIPQKGVMTTNGTSIRVNAPGVSRGLALACGGGPPLVTTATPQPIAASLEHRPQLSHATGKGK